MQLPSVLCFLHQEQLPIIIDEIGKRIILDRMHPGKKDHIDIFMDSSYEKASHSGIKDMEIRSEMQILDS